MQHFPDCVEEQSKQVNATNETSTRKSRKRKLEDEMNNLLEVESEGKKSRRRTKRRKGENGASEDCVLFDEQVRKFVWSTNKEKEKSM